MFKSLSGVLIAAFLIVIAPGRALRAETLEGEAARASGPLTEAVGQAWSELKAFRDANPKPGTLEVPQELKLSAAEFRSLLDSRTPDPRADAMRILPPGTDFQPFLAGTADLSPEERAALEELGRILGTGGAVAREHRALVDRWFQKFFKAGLVGIAPTDYQASMLTDWFPKLAGGKWTISGDQTSSYNCISWSVGVTNQWLWPGESVEVFDRLYKEYGYVPLSRGESQSKADVALWAHKDGTATHGCRRISGGYWESKLGSSYRIIHKLNALEGEVYGYVVKYYKKAGS